MAAASSYLRKLTELKLSNIFCLLMSNEASLIDDSVCSGVTYLGESAFYGKCYTEYDG